MAVVEFGPPIPLTLAKKVAARAEAEAVANGWALVFAIMDSGGNLVLLHKMDHAQLGSVAIAQGKARTALNFKRPTKAIEDAIVAGGKGVRMLAVEGLYPMEGGVLLMQHGKIIGAIGVSGASSDQDGQVAAAAITEIKD
jgi:glc operon protein GlcG